MRITFAGDFDPDVVSGVLMQILDVWDVGVDCCNI